MARIQTEVIDSLEIDINIKEKISESKRKMLYNIYSIVASYVQNKAT